MNTYTLNRSKVPSNPSLSFAKKMVEVVRGYDEIVSIGGGSTIDVGKYIAYHLKIPHTAIPTTAGTGSEVSKFAVFIENNEKISLEDIRLIPEQYVLNAENVVSLPPRQTASCGLDALSQGIESYWSPLATDVSRQWAKRAIKLATKNLWASFMYPNSLVLRERMMTAANYSGRAINITRTSICHAVSYPLTIFYDIPHGIGCAHTLPFFMRYFGFKLVSPQQVERLIKGLGAEVKEEYDIDLVIKETLKSQRSNNTPKKITRNILWQALKESISQ